MTIRKRLTLWYAGLLTLIIIAFGTSTFVVMRVTMIGSIDEALLDAAFRVRESARLVPISDYSGVSGVDIVLDPDALDVIRASNVYIQAWELIDQPALDNASLNIRNYPDPLDPHALGATHDTLSNVEIAGVPLRVLTIPIVYEGAVVGNIQVAESLETINASSRQLLLTMLISCAIAIVGAGGLSLWFSDRALRPIEDITRAADTIAGTNDLSTRLDWNGPNDELNRLISVFNRMMTRIEGLFRVQQRFVADISHELRTPLTAIRGNVEIIKRYGMDDYALEAMEAETQRMSRLVNDLLMLARADYGGISIDLTTIDLDAVVLEAYKQAQGLLHDRDLNMTLGEFEAAQIRGNADRLLQVLLNLIGNAIKFTPDGGQVVISLRRVGDQALLRVRDTGIGIRPEDLERIFDRFYQSDSSRVYSGGGFGLGLSIAKWIVEVHGGTISASSRPGVETVFTVALPLLGEITSDGVDQPTRQRIPLMRRPRADEPASRPSTRDLKIVKRDVHHETGDKAAPEDDDAPGETHGSPVESHSAVSSNGAQVIDRTQQH
jgi:signal transduction histidine kinase